MNIALGFEVGTGARVSIPLGHTIVLGQTQLSGKTTTLQAMTERSGVCAIAFITKRGEKSFRAARPIPPYFTETSTMQPYWKFVVSMIQGVEETKLGFRERGWVMQLCRDYEISKNETDAKGKKKRKSCEWAEPKTLRAVLDNARKALAFTKGVNELICLQLVEYLQMAVPEIEAAKLSSTINLKPGINVMDISNLSTNVQSLVVKSVVEWVYTTRKNTVVIIPEAWKFLPEGRSTPVSFPVEELIRQGAALKNFVWIDLQDLRGIRKLLLRSIQVWLFGVQREKNEVANTLKSMPTPEHKPSASEMMQLGIGQFIAAYGNELRRVYVWPAGMEETHAQAIALGHEDAKSWKRIAKALDEEKETDSPRETRSDEEPIGTADDERGVAQPDEPPSGSARAAEGDADGLAENGDREEAMWKEKYEALKIEFADLKAQLGELQRIHGQTVGVHADLARRVMREDSAAQAGSAEKAGADGPGNPAPAIPSNGDPGILQVNVQVPRLSVGIEKPELVVNVQRKKIEMDGTTVEGSIAVLISEGFFDESRNGKAVIDELRRRGLTFGNQTPYNRCNEIAAAGFLTREGKGVFRAVKGMKVNIVEASK